MEHITMAAANQPMPRLDSVGKLFGGAWKLLNEKGGRVLKLVAIPVVLVSLPRFIEGQVVTPFVIAAFLLALAGAVLFGIAMPASIVVYHDGAGEVEAWRRGMKLFWPFVWIGIIQVCAFSGGLVMLVVPAVMMTVWFSLSQFAFVIEGKRGMAALAQSRAYVRGYWWAVLGRTCLLGLVSVGLDIVLTIPFWIIFGPVIGYGIANLITSLALAPFSFAYSYILYRNFTALKPELTAADTPRGHSTFITVSSWIGVAVLAAIAALVVIATASNPVPPRLDIYRGNPVPSVQAPSGPVY